MGSNTYGGCQLFNEVALLTIGIFAGALIFIPLERRFPLTEVSFPRSELFLDVKHWFLSSGIARSALIVFGVLVLDQITYPDRIESFRNFVSQQNAFLQVGAILIVGDLVQYWMHRLAHTNPFLWKFHAIHHSATELDWLAAARLHPVDQAVRRIAIVLPLHLLGLSAEGIVLYLIFTPLHTLFVHSNTCIRIPFLRWIIVTPEFHHWHHDFEDDRRNYAARLPIWDLVFGSFYMPNDRRATVFGCNEPIRKSWLEHMVFPFHRRKASKVEIGSEALGEPASRIEQP